jgi:hypothetical protein
MNDTSIAAQPLTEDDGPLSPWWLRAVVIAMARVSPRWRPDAPSLVFTGGIGENDAAVRAAILVASTGCVRAPSRA